ncbi:MAG: carbohydrate kinase family protein [Candidatus Puniceispirillum sp.]
MTRNASVTPNATGHDASLPLILVIGGANIDVTATASNGDLVPAESNKGEVDFGCGGVGRNVAENLGRLGLAPQFVSVFGDDVLGQRLRQSCVDGGVRLDHAVIREGATSDIYVSMHDGAGEMQVAMHQMELIESMTPDQLDTIDPVMAAVDALVLDANLPAKTLARIFEQATGKVVFCDCVSALKAEKLIPFLGQITCLKANVNEARIVTGSGQDAETDEIMRALQQTGIAEIIMSDGANGFVAVTPNNTATKIPDGVDAMNVSGAGDALLAGFVYGWAHDMAWAARADFAHGLAQFTLSSRNAVHPDITAAHIHAHYAPLS